MQALLSFGAAAVAAMLIVAAQARGDAETHADAMTRSKAPVLGWDELSASLGASRASGAPLAAAEAASAEVDVVDAHWMALTMWGEARGQGEEAMRAVGHVIDNRRRLGRHGDFATDTVSEAWQFSCWNAGDPNREAIRDIDALPAGSREYRLWRAARRIAGEILAGRSQDPTGGALFYHADYVTPRWSRGLEPVASIGGHLFFLAAR